ncbi:DUF3987 domain-containing protein [Candidatus Igneacidithiobacillus taiwanensis]|uniref:DUF3987 domain-containing protein n=1 Tax=Candidatus Igneacidithiobacillus taiwanensis TaxID=1945924 RepID=UPI0028A173DC|nr:DUF3987 domain-containing protein [Candidatus Igneacidithiobacillus taiwanensis]
MSAYNAAEEAIHDQDDDEKDAITPPPVPDIAAMLYGIIGEIGKAGAAGREVHPVAVAAAALAWLSAEVGRDIYLPIGDTYHHARLFLLHVGRTARGGKGDSLGLVKRIRSEVARTHDGLLGQEHNGGLSTREGITLSIHDGYTLGKQEFPAITDKRLWIVESEFANVLAQGKRDGNTLLPALRDLWDGISLKPLNKSSRIWVSDPHVSLLGNITPHELRARFEKGEIMGGTLNRLMIIWAERTCLVPFPAQTNDGTVADLAGKVASALCWAKGEYPNKQNSRMASISPAAADLWMSEYKRLRAPHPAGEIIAAATERRAAYAMRIALLFAILDQSLTIEAHHLRAGIAWADYGAESAAYVLAVLDGDSRNREKESKLLEFLGNQPGKEADRWAITKVCFKNRLSGADLDKILTPLLEDGLILRREENPKAGGRKRVVYSLTTAKNAKNAKNEQRQGVEGCEETAKYGEVWAPAGQTS